ncbi:MAG: DNA-deoxyinosine glycosylase [Clostridiales bacterium]|nr:DNA-deoxyinosine glycosylase [Clostridiales bacterium]
MKSHTSYQHVIHTFEPVYDSHSQLLILGSLPSVKSREGNFYYHHPQNRFWKILARITEEKLPESIEEKKALLLRHKIAVWDVVQSCDIIGSSDSSIKNVIPTDIKKLLSYTQISRIYTNGGKAGQLYQKYCYAQTNVPNIPLPSTSPANASYSFDRLVNIWKEALFPDQIFQKESSRLHLD